MAPTLPTPIKTFSIFQQGKSANYQSEVLPRNSDKFIHSLTHSQYTSTRQKIRIFWKIAITFLTLAQNPFNYFKRFNIILEINEGKLVHNYGNFNYKYMYFLKKCIFFENFYLITGKNNKEKTTKLNNKLHPSVSILCCITSSLDDSFNATRHAVYQLLTFMGSYLIPTSLDGIFQLLTSIWLMFMQLLFHNPP